MAAEWITSGTQASRRIEPPIHASGVFGPYCDCPDLPNETRTTALFASKPKKPGWNPPGRATGPIVKNAVTTTPTESAAIAAVPLTRPGRYRVASTKGKNCETTPYAINNTNAIVDDCRMANV